MDLSFSEFSDDRSGAKLHLFAIPNLRSIPILPQHLDQFSGVRSLWFEERMNLLDIAEVNQAFLHPWPLQFGSFSHFQIRE